jgi:hypothetical protein
MTVEFKAAVTVAEMARMCSLSRSRFYQLIGTALPQPNRDEHGRPYYDADQQQVCLDVRRRNCGIDGKPILFYAPRHSAPISSPKKAQLKPAPSNPHTEIVEGVRALGMGTATTIQVDAAMKQLFPNGVAGADIGQVIRQVFLSIKRENSQNNVAR